MLIESILIIPECFVNEGNKDLIKNTESFALYDPTISTNRLESSDTSSTVLVIAKNECSNTVYKANKATCVTNSNKLTNVWRSFGDKFINNLITQSKITETVFLCETHPTRDIFFGRVKEPKQELNYANFCSEPTTGCLQNALCTLVLKNEIHKSSLFVSATVLLENDLVLGLERNGSLKELKLKSYSDGRMGLPDALHWFRFDTMSDVFEITTNIMTTCRRKINNSSLSAVVVSIRIHDTRNGVHNIFSQGHIVSIASSEMIFSSSENNCQKSLKINDVCALQQLDQTLGSILPLLVNNYCQDDCVVSSCNLASYDIFLETTLNKFFAYFLIESSKKLTICIELVMPLPSSDAVVLNAKPLQLLTSIEKINHKIEEDAEKNRKHCGDSQKNSEISLKVENQLLREIITAQTALEYLELELLEQERLEFTTNQKNKLTQQTILEKFQTHYLKELSWCLRKHLQYEDLLEQSHFSNISDENETSQQNAMLSFFSAQRSLVFLLEKEFKAHQKQTGLISSIQSLEQFEEMLNQKKNANSENNTDIKKHLKQIKLFLYTKQCSSCEKLTPQIKDLEKEVDQTKKDYELKLCKYRQENESLQEKTQSLTYQAEYFKSLATEFQKQLIETKKNFDVQNSAHSELKRQYESVCRILDIQVETLTNSVSRSSLRNKGVTPQQFLTNNNFEKKELGYDLLDENTIDNFSVFKTPQTDDFKFKNVNENFFAREEEQELPSTPSLLKSNKYYESNYLSEELTLVTQELCLARGKHVNLECSLDTSRNLIKHYEEENKKIAEECSQVTEELNLIKLQIENLQNSCKQHQAELQQEKALTKELQVELQLKRTELDKVKVENKLLCEIKSELEANKSSYDEIKLPSISNEFKINTSKTVQQHLNAQIELSNQLKEQILWMKKALNWTHGCSQTFIEDKTKHLKELIKENELLKKENESLNKKIEALLSDKLKLTDYSRSFEALSTFDQKDNSRSNKNDLLPSAQEVLSEKTTLKKNRCLAVSLTQQKILEKSLIPRKKHFNIIQQQTLFVNPDFQYELLTTSLPTLKNVLVPTFLSYISQCRSDVETARQLLTAAKLAYQTESDRTREQLRAEHQKFIDLSNKYALLNQKKIIKFKVYKFSFEILGDQSDALVQCVLKKPSKFESLSLVPLQIHCSFTATQQSEKVLSINPQQTEIDSDCIYHICRTLSHIKVQLRYTVRKLFPDFFSENSEKLNPVNSFKNIVSLSRQCQADALHIQKMIEEFLDAAESTIDDLYSRLSNEEKNVKQLKEELDQTEKDLDKLVAHNNLNQRICHHLKVKQENKKLKEENSKLLSEIGQLTMKPMNTKQRYSFACTHKPI